MQAYGTPATGFTPELRLVGRFQSQPIAARPDSRGVLIEHLLGQLAELVADRLAARLAEPQNHGADEWLDTRRAAEYLGIGRDSVRRLAAEGSIPTEQAGVGCKLYFRRSSLDEWRCSCSGPIEPLRARRHG
jgi:excisionase family DNA binding protein